MSEGVIGSGWRRFALRTVVWPGGSFGPRGSGIPQTPRPHGVVPHLLFEVFLEV
jgi:hypothetical protein